MNIDEVMNGWTFEETIKTAESFMEAEKNMFKWDVIRHLRDFAETYREQLKEYQQLEEQGRLIKLPCKCGDVVYVTEPALVEAMCIRIQLDGYRNGIWINAKEYPYDRWISFKAFGKTVFPTKSEAEAKLKELRGGKDGR